MATVGGSEVVEERAPGAETVEHATVHVQRAEDHDEEFTAFARAAVPALARTAWLLCGDAHRAEELVQQTLVRTYLAWPSARAGEPLAYARRVLANQRIDTWRSRRREVLTAPESMPEPRLRPVDADHVRYDELVRALQRLPARRRRAVVLRHVLGLSEAQAAADLGISVGAVKSATSRGLAQLRAALAERPTTTTTSGPQRRDEP